MDVAKSSNDQLLTGVCGGLAEHFEMDSTLMRIIFVVGTLITGLVPGLLVYLVLFLLMED
jgi:phage shock protein PspC (stress-responsive transcriptional regulator)